MRVLGLDIGIASIGWSVIEIFVNTEDQNSSGRVVAAGVWMFDPPEEKSQMGSKLKTEMRRLFRGQRRVIKRRRQRMNEIRALFAKAGLLPNAEKNALAIAHADPWRFRNRGLDHVLTGAEFAIALGHIARHRGFKSTAKGAKKNAADEDGKMLAESARTKEKLARYATPARMLFEDDAYVLRLTPKKDGGTEEVRRFRNREGDYSRSLLRDDLAAEVRQLFRAQRRMGQDLATEALEEEFCRIAFFPGSLQDSEAMVGDCLFERDEKRASRRAPSFELFRFLSRLNTLSLIEPGGGSRRLSVEEIGKASSDFGATAKVTFANLRKKLGLPADVRFDGAKPDEESKRDVVARSGDAADGTARLRKLIAGNHGEMSWQSLRSRPEILDRIVQVVTFRHDMEQIKLGLAGIAMDADLRNTIVAAAQKGDFDGFSGAGHLSAKAARAIIPGLLQGLTYDKACAMVGYDHTVSRERHAFDLKGEDGQPVVGKLALARILTEERVSASLIGSPTARKAIIEALKQIKALVEEFGLPDRIHVEMARDVGKSIEERGKIDRGIEKRNRQKDKLREIFAEKLGRAPLAGARGIDELMRFELWEQQNCRCLYTDEYIAAERLLDGNNTVQVDHILPWGRFGDDSFHNKTLCTAKANQDKKGRTPYEWFFADKTPEAWEAFEARLREIPNMKGLKRRNYSLRNAAEVQERFRNSNLNDTRWACRVLAEALKQVLPDIRDENGDLRRRVFARPGALTDRLRRAWGLQWIKKDGDGNRIPDDRHHALDATIVAATTESLLNRATREIQELEKRGDKNGDLLRNIGQPWSGFHGQVLEHVGSAFVARAPRHRARGKAHDATIQQIVEEDGTKKVYGRKAIEKLSLADLEKIKDPDRNAATIASLREWIVAGKPRESDRLPKSPKGDPIGKISVESKGKVNVLLYRGGHNNPPGTADRGEMARVDVFRKANAKGNWQFFWVPVYPHDIAMLDSPPMRAVTANKPEEMWPVMDPSYEFLWSMVPMTLLKVVDQSGTVFFPEGQADGNLGYFRGLDRSTGAIILSSIIDQTNIRKGIGARTLHSLQKLTVDRLGRTFNVAKETRTWRGKACI
ncbi:type II CRISPR RNA-guided endonuclease Cas9 [Agrobacterium sp. NPDC090283]|uniref:type II CRISPR RNA-guided endonuclease Cas9 n=1 Tax=Agrobacterium sp. NPDC090283 TaxID=3363920 RepID=UPI00383A9375